MNFKIGRIRIRISFLFFSMLTMLFAVDEKGIALIALASAVFHELGHIVALFLFGSCPDEICFGIFGIRIQQNKNVLSDFKQGIVVLSGPFVNALIFLIMLMLYSVFQINVFMIISAVNFVSAIFNLIPIFPLDGGRFLLTILSALLTDRATRITMRVICAVCLPLLGFFGIILVRKTGANISLLATGIYLGVLCIKSIRI